MALNSLCADVPLRNYSLAQSLDRKPICCKADNAPGLLPLLAQPDWQPCTRSTPLPTVAVGSHVTHGVGMRHGHIPIWVARFIYRDDLLLNEWYRSGINGWYRSGCCVAYIRGLTTYGFKAYEREMSSQWDCCPLPLPLLISLASSRRYWKGLKLHVKAVLEK